MKGDFVQNGAPPFISFRLFIVQPGCLNCCVWPVTPFSVHYSPLKSARRSSHATHISPGSWILAPEFWTSLLQFSFEPPAILRHVGSLTVLPPNVMEVAGTVSWILAQKKITTVWTIHPDATVYDAIKMMADKNVGALPVVQNDRLVGIISERDYTRKVILQGRSSKETRVSEIMSTNLVVTHPNESLTGCMRVMTERRIRHLPVVEDGKLIGILSIGDALKWVISAQTATIEHLEQYISGGYPS